MLLQYISYNLHFPLYRLVSSDCKLKTNRKNYAIKIKINQKQNIMPINCIENKIFFEIDRFHVSCICIYINIFISEPKNIMLVLIEST